MFDARSESSSASELNQVQLAHLDIDPDTLTAGGPGLWDVIGTDRAVEVRAPREQLDGLPRTGWRVVRSRPAGAMRGRAEMLAAPYLEPPATWAVVNLVERDGKWWLSADPGPLPIHRGRAQRRRALRLSWPDGLTAPAGVVPDLQVMLTNVSPHTWINETGGSAHIRSWVLDEDGHRIEQSPWFAFGHAETSTLPDLDPGRSIMVPTALATPDVGSLPPGRYVLDASLVQLNLRAQPGTLTLT